MLYHKLYFEFKDLDRDDQNIAFSKKYTTKSGEFEDQKHPCEKQVHSPPPLEGRRKFLGQVDFLIFWAIFSRFLFSSLIWVFPKNRGTPKWMVKTMENPLKMDDLGGTPIFRKHPNMYQLGLFGPSVGQWVLQGMVASLAHGKSMGDLRENPEGRPTRVGPY